MAKSIHPISYRYDFEGHEIVVTRRHLGSAYARNGNVGNPTEYFNWESTLDGERVSVAHTRAVAYEYARAKALGIRYRNDEAVPRRPENVRPWTVVQDEMQTNCRGRSVL